MREPWHARVRGPLAAHAVDFRVHVVGLGYAPPSVDALRRLFGDLSVWLDDRGLGLESLVTGEIDEFLEQRRRSGVPLYSRRGLRPLLGYVKGLGLLPAPVVVRTPLDRLLGDYRRYLVVERSLAELTVAGYMKTATLFAAECLGDNADCVAVSARDVSSFLARAGVGHKPKTVNNIVRAALVPAVLVHHRPGGDAVVGSGVGDGELAGRAPASPGPGRHGRGHPGQLRSGHAVRRS
jgi:integrase/recombinase XerD